MTGSFTVDPGRKTKKGPRAHREWSGARAITGILRTGIHRLCSFQASKKSLRELFPVKVTRPVVARCAMDFQTARGNTVPPHALVELVLLLVHYQCDLTGVLLQPVPVHCSRIVLSQTVNALERQLIRGLRLNRSKLPAPQIPHKLHSRAVATSYDLAEDVADMLGSTPSIVEVES